MLGDDPLLDSSARKSFDLVILDEAHHIKNPSAGQSKAVAQLSPTYRWALTGTPVQNSLGDLITIFGFVKPGLISSDHLTESGLTKRIEPYFLRRRKMDVLADLPEKVTQDMWLEMDPDQRDAYQQALQRGRDGFNSGTTAVTRIHIFALLRKLMQISNFAPEKGSSPKTRVLLDQLETILDQHKAVVFTNYLGEGVDKLRPHLAKYGLVEITGKTAPAMRRRAIDEFMDNPDMRVFLGTTKAAGEGITLTEGNYVFHFDQWWNPAVAWQAEDRVHRMGQNKQVNVYSYWMEDTIEERIHQILERKGMLFDEVVNAMSERDIDSAIKMDEWCEILGLEVKPKPERAEVPEHTKTGLDLGEAYRAFSEMDPREFEDLVADVFRRLGYPDARVVGGAYDGGIDVRASRPAVGGKERIVIQCKRRPQVGVSVARELLGSVQDNPRVSKGFLVVSGKLSPECQRFIDEHGTLSAMTGFQLAKYVVDFGISLPS